MESPSRSSFQQHSRIWGLTQRVLALLLLALLSPVLVGIGIVVVATSPGPAIFSQLRPGRGRRMFWVHKFRTMETGSDAIESLQLGVTRAEPRVTRVGRVLRELKIDELPQLWNVVRGEMCFVGPRPIGPALDEMLTRELPGFSTRYDVAPGMTSLGQVCIDDNSQDIKGDWRLRSQAERHYVQNGSALYDGIVLALTMVFLMRRLGAKVMR